MMNSKLKIKDITAISVCSVLLVIAQVAMRFLPNIEVVSLFILLFTKHFKKKTLYIIYIFVLVEGLIYGFGMWWITYTYVWTILYFICLFVRDVESPFALSIVLAIYGLLFGAFSSIAYFVTLGVGGGISWIISGFMFDLMHCIGNFATTLILYKPLNNIMKRII